ncbi:MAG: arylsulfatase A [Rhodothermales bacterium]
MERDSQRFIPKANPIARDDLLSFFGFYGAIHEDLPLGDGKGSSYEGGQRVPTIMRWPGKIAAGSECAEVAMAMDLLPTFAAVTGVKLPADLKLKPDGRDIQTLMTGSQAEKTLYEAFYFNGRGVRAGKWEIPRGTTLRELVGRQVDRNSQ